MKVIDIINIMEKGKGIPNKIKLECVNNITKENCTYKFNPLVENYVNTNGGLLTNATYFGTLLHLEIEIIGEPKEELEELEEIEFAKAGDLMITIINKLIENQNKIIRELKANK